MRHTDMINNMAYIIVSLGHIPERIKQLLLCEVLNRK